ncbi:MAG TPA: substrate-binding domain-containing protein [Amaricoccus sp.]|nr:substrate-binding domain-containing protein [Amaricoccus sp.]
MQRTLIAGVAVVMAMAGAVQAQDKPQLAFVVNGASDFWKLAEAGVAKAQGELPGYELQFRYPAQATAALQNALMDDLVAAGTDAIMISSADPKTSIDALAWLKSYIIAVSVISRSSRLGSMPLDRMMLAIVATLSGELMSWVDRLNERPTLSGQRQAAASAFLSSTHVRSPIRPIRSATGMKRPGDTDPKTGLFQRARASKAIVRPLWISMMG